jgi:hypothetical protein
MMDINTYIQWIVTCGGGPYYTGLPPKDYYKQTGFEYENWLATFIRQNADRLKNFNWDQVLSIAFGKAGYDPQAVKKDYNSYISTYGDEVGKILFCIKYSHTYCPWRPDVVVCYKDCHPMRNLVIVTLKDGRVFTVKPQNPEDMCKVIRILKYDAVSYIEASDSTAGPPGSTSIPSFDSLIQTLETEYWKLLIQMWSGQPQGSVGTQPSAAQPTTAATPTSRTLAWIVLGAGALVLLLLAFQKG